MKDTIRIGLLTLIVFATGLGVGIWTQHIKPVPAPPMQPLGEMSGFHHGGPGRGWGAKGEKGDHSPGKPSEPGRREFFGKDGDEGQFPFSAEKAEEMKAAIKKIEPQIKAFEEKLGAIETDFRAQFTAILTPEQKKRFEEKAPPPFNAPPGGSAFPDRMMGPLGGMAFFTIITPGLEHMSKDLSLTPDQQAKLKALLIGRRQKFLELVDTTPPPSLQLGHMAAPPPGS